MTKSKIKEDFGSRIFDVINVILMGAIMIITLYPMIYILFASLSKGNLLLGHTGLLFHPLGFSLEGYNAAFKDPMIVKGYANTLFIVLAGGFLSLAVSALGAYALSRKNFMMVKPVMLTIVFTMFFSGGMIPYYFTVRELGLYNSTWALILPSLVSTFNLIIMRTGFASVPDSLIEAATIDGADHFRTFWSVVLPLVKPVLAVIALYYTVSKWNAWFDAMLFLQDRAKYPLQLILRGILLANDTSLMTGSELDQEAIGESIKYGVIVIATLPILCVYPFLQKYFVKGVMVGAVKG